MRSYDSIYDIIHLFAQSFHIFVALFLGFFCLVICRTELIKNVKYKKETFIENCGILRLSVCMKLIENRKKNICREDQTFLVSMTKLNHLIVTNKLK